jgi:hypothetical protein
MLDPTRSLVPYAALILALIAATPVWGGPSPQSDTLRADTLRADTMRADHSAKKGKKGKGGKGGKNDDKGKAGKGGKGKGGKNAKNDGVGPFKKKDYPISERLRPLVLPNEMGQVGLDLGVGRTFGATSLGTNVSFDYGVGDYFDFGLATGLLLAPDVAWNGLILQGHGLAYDSKEVDFAPGLVLSLPFSQGAFYTAVIDLPTRVVLPEGFFLRFGQGAVPVTLSPDFGLAIVGNGGVGFQIDPKVALFADTSLFTLTLAPDAAISGPWNNLWLSIGGQYSPTRAWDAGAALGLSNSFGVPDSLGIGLTGFGRYRF